MATVASVLTDRVRRLLRDTDAVQWTDAELLDWLNDAARELSRVFPEATSETGVLTLAEGSTQALPPGAFMLLEVLCNADSDGAALRTIRRADRIQLDNSKPHWRYDATAALAQHYVISLSNPRTFFVYPPNDGTGHLLAVYAQEPPEVALVDDFPLPETLLPVAVDYICYRALLKMLESPSAQEQAAKYKALFDGAVRGAMEVNEMKGAPQREPLHR